MRKYVNKRWLMKVDSIRCIEDEGGLLSRVKQHPAEFACQYVILY